MKQQGRINAQDYSDWVAMALLAEGDVMVNERPVFVGICLYCESRMVEGRSNCVNCGAPYDG